MLAITSDLSESYGNADLISLFSKIQHLLRRMQSLTIRKLYVSYYVNYYIEIE